jgi:tRNA pseudouridine38-40 synthase
MRLKLTIAYDGRPFNGWQSQPGGNTVQDHLHRALQAIAKQPVPIQGSGRTDTGVHALGQVAHFDAPPNLTLQPGNWVPALNTKLPPTIRVMHCDEVPPEFHARFSALGKTYHYDICTDPVLPPHRAGLAWHLPQVLNPAVLTETLDRYLGRHDFHAFAAYRGNESAASDYQRTIHRAELAILTDGYRLTFVGDGFLYKMVRLLTGAAVKVAQGRFHPTEFAALLDQPAGLPHGKSNHCAPADGLYLQAVHYPADG